MIILHMVWDKNTDKFLVWGESSERFFDNLKNDRHHESSHQNYHFYTIPKKEIESIINSIFPRKSLYYSKNRTIYLPFPSISLDDSSKHNGTRDYIPYPSPQLHQYIKIHNFKPDTTQKSQKRDKQNLGNESPQNLTSNKKNEEIRQKISSYSKRKEIDLINYYAVEAIQLRTHFVLDAIVEARGDFIFDNDNEKVQFGESFRFWQESALFCLTLLVKNRYYPHIHQVSLNNLSTPRSNSIFSATWGMSLTTTLSQLLYHLINNIPPLCHTKIKNEPKSVQLNPKSPSEDESEIFHNAEDFFKTYLNFLMDGYIRSVFNTPQEYFSKDFLMEKMCVRQRTQRSTEEQRILERLANALFLQEVKPIELPSNIEKRYRKYLTLTQPTTELGTDKIFYTVLKIIPPKSTSDLIGFMNKSTENKKWKLELCVEAMNNEFSQIPIKSVLNESNNVLHRFKIDGDKLKEYIFNDLTRLKKKYAFIEKYFHQTLPTKITISVEDAYSLIQKAQYLLDYEGVKIIIPEELKVTSSKLGMILHLNSDFGTQRKLLQKNEGINNETGNFGLNSIVKYNWRIALGDQELSYTEFKKLAKLKVPLIRIRGNWVQISKNTVSKIKDIFKFQEIQNKDGQSSKSSESGLVTRNASTIIDSLRSDTNIHLSGNMTLSEALKMEEFIDSGDTDEESSNFYSKEKEMAIPILDIKGDTQLEALLSKFKYPKKISIIKTIPNFHGELRPYQTLGVSWLLFMKKFGIGACLADDMGLGKTIQIIGLLLYEKEYLLPKHSPSMALVICPMSILGNWKKEINKFAPSLKVFIHHGSNRLNPKDLDPLRDRTNPFEPCVHKFDVVLTTYSLARRDGEILRIPKWNTLIVDESQNIKNHQAKRTRAIKKIQANHKIALTGTPIENRLSELWSLMDFLNKNYLSNLSQFNQEYIKPIERYRNKTQALKLKKIIQPFILRRLKTDKKIIKDLPNKREMHVYCNLTKEQVTLYEAIVQEMMEKIETSDGIERKGLVLSTITKLKQVCNHPSQFLHSTTRDYKNRSGKLTRLGEMIMEAISEGDKVLIFTQYREMGNIIQYSLRNQFKIDAAFLHGGVPQKKREEMVENFQTLGMENPAFIVSLKAGGTGLNLTAANNVFHFDRWWNPAVENQATDRVFRIGQTKNVNVYKYICLGTIEEKIQEIIESKKELAQNIIGTGESWITELSTKELKELFQLSNEYK